MEFLDNSIVLIYIISAVGKYSNRLNFITLHRVSIYKFFLPLLPTSTNFPYYLVFETLFRIYYVTLYDSGCTTS